jgi:Zn-dependent peptidase ImmA (M78 family)/DNA-binding XRE family transcriptional regulator
MIPRLRAIVNPDALNWGRRVAGFSTEDAAKRAGTSRERLEKWESGKAHPTLRQLRLLARAYRRPSAFFFRSELPPEPPGIPDLRLLPEAPFDQGDSPPLLYEIRRVQARRETALEIMGLLGDDPPEVTLRAEQRDGAETVGERLRTFLGVRYGIQYAWRDHYEALREWTRAAERRGILVFQFSDVEVQEARGFSLPNAPLPIVALNGKDSPRGRIFTLMHELAHVALGQAGLCDLHDRDHIDWVEPFCNAVAAEALVPRTQLPLAAEVREHRGGHEWSDRSLLSLSNKFMVSREVVLRRLLALGMTSAEFYEAKRAQFLKEYRLQEENQDGFLQYFRRVLRDNGEAFTSLVLSAYDQKSISERDVSHHLGDVKLIHVDSIRAALAGAAD